MFLLLSVGLVPYPFLVYRSHFLSFFLFLTSATFIYTYREADLACLLSSSKYNLPLINLGSYNAWLRSKYPSQHQAASHSASGTANGSGHDLRPVANAQFFFSQTDGAFEGELATTEAATDHETAAFNHNLNTLTATPNTGVPQQIQDIPTTASQEADGLSQRQLSFDTLSHLIASGSDIPGIEEVPEGKADVSLVKPNTVTLRDKPWEATTTNGITSAAATTSYKGAYGEDVDSNDFILIDKPWYEVEDSDAPANDGVVPAWQQVKTVNTEHDEMQLDELTFRERSMAYE